MIHKENCCIEQSLVLPSKGQNLAPLRHFAANFVKQCAYSDHDVFDVTIAVGEACANALEHGSPLGEKNNITVICKCMDDYLLVKVRDEGTFKKKVNFELSERHSISGRGILLMLAVMDKVSIDESSSGTTVKFVKKHKPGTILNK